MKESPEFKNLNILQFMVKDRYRLLRHSALLAGILVIIFYSDWLSEYHGADKYYRLSCVFCVLIMMSYFNMYVLVPKFFFNGRYILYMVLLFVLVIIGLGVMSVLLDYYLKPVDIIAHHNERRQGYAQYNGTVTLIPILLVTTMIKLFQRWTKDNERIAELNDITLKMELNELRNQINPHFFFNMLNGIKALVRTDPEKATRVIMKLSEFLRYQIYDNNEEKTLLQSEITFLSNFLNLEVLRRDRLSVDIITPDVPGILNGIFLPPNLFTTFVENAVKHSVDVSDGEPYIRIEFVMVEDQLHFFCINSKDPMYIASDQKNSGLGLANIKRRLELLYQETYSLTVDSTENRFSIVLKLPL